MPSVSALAQFGRSAAALAVLALAIVAPSQAGPAAAERSSAAARRATVRLGDLVLAYDPEAWRIRALPERFEATCLGDDCRDAGVAGWLTAQPATSCSGSVGTNAADRHSHGAVYRLQGLVLYANEIDLGCRNLVPRRLEACTAWAGRVYRFASGPHGCRGVASRGSASAAIDLLRGLAAP